MAAVPQITGIVMVALVLVTAATEPCICGLIYWCRSFICEPLRVLLVCCFVTVNHEHPDIGFINFTGYFALN